MVATGRLWLVGYAVAQALFWLGFSIYYTFTRLYIEDVLGQDYAFVALLVGAEEAPLLLAVVLGFLADRLGRRRALLLGFGEALAVGLMGLTGIGLLPALAAVAAGFYAFAYSALTGIVLAGVGGSGWRYSLVTLLSSVGWALGGLIAGLLYPRGPLVSYAASALFIALGYTVAYILAPPGEERGTTSVSLEAVVRASRHLLPLVASIVLSATGLMLFYGAASLKLASELEDPVVFGLVFSTLSALLGALVRPLAGILSDRVDPIAMIVWTSLAYAVLNLGIAVTHGLVMAILWLIPIYPFREIAVYMAVSRSLPRELQATAAGIVSFAISISGLIMMAASPLVGSAGVLEIYLASTLLLVASVLVLLKTLLSPRHVGQRFNTTTSYSRSQ